MLQKKRVNQLVLFVIGLGLVIAKVEVTTNNCKVGFELSRVAHKVVLKACHLLFSLAKEVHSLARRQMNVAHAKLLDRIERRSFELKLGTQRRFARQLWTKLK